MKRTGKSMKEPFCLEQEDMRNSCNKKGTPPPRETHQRNGKDGVRKNRKKEEKKRGEKNIPRRVLKLEK